MKSNSNSQSNLPLVCALQESVSAWREGGYKDGTTETTRRLLEWWFKEEHIIKKEEFKFWKAQKQAIEALIYCYEVLSARSLYNLSQQLDVSIPLDPKTDRWAKYAFKMATGSGKTMVMAMVIIWSYFNAIYEKDLENYTKNFLLIAPNLIVLDRLLGDSKNPEFINNGIFKKFPLIPPEWKKDFQLDVIGPNDPPIPKKQGVLFLTNWQKFVERENNEADNPIQDLLGSKPSSDIKITTEKLKEVLSSFKNFMVLNDEAHHVWDEKLIWVKLIDWLNEQSGLMCQLDFSATPKFQTTGGLFPHIITDYSLGEAVDDDIVKRPKIAEIENIPEIESDNAVEKYKVQIDAGVDEWRKSFKNLKPTGKKPVLFLMAEKTRAADNIKEYLDKFPDLAGKVLIIHTDNTGEVSKSDIEKARKWAREVDSEDNPYRAIVSVLMLREGWDVRNVTVIVPLRPLTAKAKILPEQTLGRGLRRMWPQHHNWMEELTVIEHPQFHDLIEEALTEQGIKPNFVKIEEAFKPTVIIKTEESKKDFDIAIPVSRGGLSRTMKPLEKLKASQLPAKLFRVSDLKPLNIKLRKKDLRTKKIESERILQFPFADRPEIYISAIAKAVERDSRVTGQFDKLVPVVKDYILNRLFDKKVKLNEDILKKLNKGNVRYAILDVFSDKINEMTAVTEDLEMTGEEIKASNIKPFPWSKKVLEAKKTILNYVPLENDFEVAIARFLDKDDDVKVFIKNETRTLGFRIPYIDRDGYLRSYIPDFIVKTKDGMGIIESKGREDVDVKFKDNRAKEWAKQMSKLDGKKWFYLRIDQKDFERKKYSSLSELIK